MIRKIIFLISISVLAACVNLPKKQTKQIFYISFNGGFDIDNVSLYINNSEIFKDIKMTSDEILSLTGYFVVFYSDNQLLFYKNKTENIIYKNELILNHKSFDVMVIVNNDTVTKTINLSKGKNILVDASYYTDSPEIRQFKEMVYYE